MAKKAKKAPFDPKAFLATLDGGRTISHYRKDQTLFSQGSSADAVFYIRSGKVKVTVVSEQGKEAVVAMLGPDEFCGEGCLAGQPLRMSTAGPEFPDSLHLLNCKRFPRSTDGFRRNEARETAYPLYGWFTGNRGTCHN